LTQWRQAISQLKVRVVSFGIFGSRGLAGNSVRGPLYGERREGAVSELNEGEKEKEENSANDCP
jgi:hypothetical protein